MIQLCKFFLFYLLISIDFHTFSLRNPLKINPMDNILFWLVPVASVLALCFAYYFHKQMMKESEGTPQMIKIAAAVRKGAMSYLKQQYKIVGWVFLGLVILFSIMAYGFHVQNAWVPIAFLTGGFFSGLSGFLGMKTATYASARTANAARTSLNAGLRIAFRSGAVMGLVVVGLGLLDISFWYLLLNAVIPADALTPTHKLCVITTTMLTFGMGASTQALFARVGGGIYSNGKLHHGMLHPETGHVLITKRTADTYAGRCPYHKNCLEGLAAGPAIEERWGRKAVDLADCPEVWELEADYIAQALTCYVMTVSPEMIILGGGVMHQEQLFPLIRKKLKEYINGYIATDELADMEHYVVPASLHDDQGIMGCLELARRALENDH